MKTIKLGTTGLQVPAIAVGCMRLADFTTEQMEAFLHGALERGAYFFDHADIYGGGKSEQVFGAALRSGSFRREDMILQSKCGIQRGMYDLSAAHIIEAVEGSLSRLGTDYLDILLLHRPDALVEPEEVAEVFDRLEASGKVKYFGVSNHKPMQIELLKKCVKQPLHINQLQFSLPVSNMVANGMEVNMDSPGSADRDGSVLDYSRLHNMTIQAWSPFQMANWQGTFLGSDRFPALNAELAQLAEQYGVTPTAIAAAWVLRHPAGMQLISGTTKLDRLDEILSACDVNLTRAEWYRLYLAAGHPLP